MATEALSDPCGGVVIFYREVEHFAIKEIRLHGVNVISFQLVKGRKGWHAVGCYIVPIGASAIEDVTAAIRDQPLGAELLVSGDLNANLAEPEGTPQGETIVDDLVVVGLMDMGIHFLPWRKPWLQDGCKYSMQRDGREVRSRTDYILGTDHRLFRDLAVWDT